jgi:hypothetical protein
MTKTQSPLIVIILMSLLFVLLMGGSLLGLQTSHPGYLTGTQGLEAQFQSVYFDGAYWSGTETPSGTSPSVMNFGYDMTFDPDGATVNRPDLCATQQPITVDADVEPKLYSWQIKTETGKTLENGTIVDVYTQYDMLRYQCDWATNVWLSGTENEAMGRESVILGDRETALCNYAGTTIWLKIMPRSFIYFMDNPKHVYFAPCYMGLSEEVEWASLDEKGQKIVDDTDIKSTEDMIPKAKGETVGIYYQRGGGDIVTEDTYLKYKDEALDPEIFREEYWIRFSLSNFKPINWRDWGIYHNWKFPSAYLHFLVYVFVVGEWEVYIKTGEVPHLEPHTPIVHITDISGGIFDWLTNPWTLFYLGIIGSIILLVLLLVFAPGLLIVVAKGIFGRRKGGGKG